LNREKACKQRKDKKRASDVTFHTWGGQTWGRENREDNRRGTNKILRQKKKKKKERKGRRVENRRSTEPPKVSATKRGLLAESPIVRKDCRSFSSGPFRMWKVISPWRITETETMRPGAR